MGDIPETVSQLKNKHPEAISDVNRFRDEFTVLIKPDAVIDICSALKEDGFLMLNDITAVHPSIETDFFFVAYHVFSQKMNLRLRVKTKVPVDNPELPSVTGVWRAADWYERETYDLFGIRFIGHPNLVRILTPDGFEGFPLRKDFPVEGRR